MLAIVLRHGECGGFPEADSLTRAGLDQVETAVRKIMVEHSGRSFPVREIYADPSLASSQSARICAAPGYLNIGDEKIHIISDLAGAGIDAVDLSDLKAKMAAEQKPWFEFWLNGYAGFEKPEYFRERVIRAFEEITHEQKAQGHKPDNPDNYVLFIVSEEVFWGIITHKKNNNQEKVTMLDMARRYRIGYGVKRIYLF